MPDNKTYQQSLVDRGWSEMERILDREMPIRRNRRFAFIWLGVAALIVAASVIMMQVSGVENEAETIDNIIHQKSEQQTPPEQNESGPTAMLGDSGSSGEIRSEGQVPGQNMASAPSESIQVDPAESVTRSNSEVATKAQSEKQNTGSSTFQNQASEAPDINESTLQQGESHAFAGLDGDISGESEIQSKEERVHSQVVPDKSKTVVISEMSEKGAKVETIQNDDQREVYPVAMLSSHTPEALLHPEVLSAAAIIPQKNAGKFGLDLIARAHMNGQGDPLYGAEAGIAAVFRAHRRVQIMSGISYGYYGENGLGVFGSEANEALIDLNNQPGNPYGVSFDVQDVYANTIAYDSAKLLTDKFHYLHIPLSIAYRITPRISVWGGAKASLLIAAPSKYRLDDQIFSSAGTTEQNNSRSFLYDYDVLRKFDVSPEIGVSWQAARGLWLEAAYRHGLVPYINRSGVSERSDYHRSISVGLRLRMI